MKQQPLPNKLAPGVYQTIYPVYTCASDGRGVLLTAGGGGGGRHGVKNMIQAHIMDESKTAMLTMATLDTGDTLPSFLHYSEDFRLFTAVLKDQVLVFALDEPALFQFKVLALLPVVQSGTSASVRFAKMFNHAGERSIMAGLDSGELRIFRFGDSASLTLLHVLQHSAALGGKDGEVVDADWRSDGNYIVSSAKNGTTKIWDISQPEALCKANLNVPANGLCARACRFLTDAEILVAYYGPRGPSLLAKFDQGKLQAQANIPGRSAISSVALSPDKKRILLGFAGGNHEVWNAEKLKLISRGSSDEHEMPITAVALFADGGLTGSADFTIRMLNKTPSSSGFWGRLATLALVSSLAFALSHFSPLN